MTNHGFILDKEKTTEQMFKVCQYYDVKNVDLAEFEAAKAYFYDTRDEIIYGEEKEYTGGLDFNDYLATIFKLISDLLYYFFDGAGFSDM